MRQRHIDLVKSTSSCITDSNEFYIRGHFRWDTIKKFIYFANAFSSTCYNFDIFSKVIAAKAHLIEYIIYALFIGVSYMFMDLFIKNYTRRLDTNKNMNPLMRGISFGILMQTALWTVLVNLSVYTVKASITSFIIFAALLGFGRIIRLRIPSKIFILPPDSANHASDLADSFRFFLVVMNKSPAWTNCKAVGNSTCMSSEDVILHCRNNLPVDIKITSAHINYRKWFTNFDRNNLSMRLFIVAIVWIANFFITTIADSALLKLFRISFLWGTFSTAFILIFLLFSTEHTAKAFYDIMNIKDYFFDLNAFNLVTDPFGVGLIGVYDFGTLSPFTMIDTAILVFAAVFIIIAFARSLIVRVLYLTLTRCVYVNLSENQHYLLFTILPLSTEFLDAHKIFVIYIYSYLMAALISCLAMFTSTTSRLLHSEFRSVKNVYIVGLLCFLGFTLSMPLAAMTLRNRVGILHGLNTCTLYLGGFKMAIVMWLYGVQTYATDIHFWLGFKPAQFWRCFWSVLPVLIWVIVCNKIVYIIHFNNLPQKISALAWIGLTLSVVLIFHIKAIAKYVLKNNIAGVLRSNFKYGPPDSDDRKRRRNFDEIMQNRQCRHDCMILDDKYECNHLPLISKSRSNIIRSESSFTNIYKGPEKKKGSSIIDVTVLEKS